MAGPRVQSLLVHWFVRGLPPGWVTSLFPRPPRDCQTSLGSAMMRVMDPETSSEGKVVLNGSTFPREELWPELTQLATTFQGRGNISHLYYLGWRKLFPSFALAVNFAPTRNGVRGIDGASISLVSTSKAARRVIRGGGELNSHSFAEFFRLNIASRGRYREN